MQKIDLPTEPLTDLIVDLKEGEYVENPATYPPKKIYGPQKIQWTVYSDRGRELILLDE